MSAARLMNVGRGLTSVMRASARAGSRGGVAGAVVARRMVHSERSGGYRMSFGSPVAATIAGATAMGVVAAGLSVSAEAPAESPDMVAVRAGVEDILEQDPDMGPTLIRLAWHASGTYDVVSKTGGSDGATMRFAPESGHGANAGLGKARDVLAPIAEATPGMSTADIWVFASLVALEYMGGPQIPFRGGRKDAESGESCPPEGRLPDADKGQVGATIAHIRAIFGRQGFNDQEMAALIGAHALGRCHAEASGYVNPWTRSPVTFSNMYYKELLENTWTLKKWDGPDQFEDPTGDLMMLPTDMALIWDKEFRKYTEVYAADEEKFAADFAKAYQKLVENGVKAIPAKKGGFLGLW